jgi:hypothetical protein
MLVFGFVDLVYLIVPHVPHDVGDFARYSEFAAAHASDSPHLFDPTLLGLTLGMFCLVLSMTMRSLMGKSLLASRDPSLGESLAFQNM